MAKKIKFRFWKNSLGDKSDPLKIFNLKREDRIKFSTIFQENPLKCMTAHKLSKNEAPYINKS